MSSYNINTNAFTSIVVRFEFDIGGNIVPSIDCSILRIHLGRGCLLSDCI